MRVIMLIMLLLVQSCKNDVKTVSMNSPSEPIDKLKEKVQKGDTTAYEKLYISYMDEPQEEFLFWAILMANKYNYKSAYLDVFLILKNSFNENIEDFDLSNMDSTSRTMALNYLKAAVERNLEEAKEDWILVQRADSLRRISKN